MLFKEQAIPLSTHQSPCLEEILFFHLLILEILRYALQTLLHHRGISVLYLLYILMALMSLFAFVGLGPILYHLKPLVVIIQATFSLKFRTIQTLVKTKLLIFVGYLREQPFPSITLPDRAPIGHLLHALQFSLSTGISELLPFDNLFDKGQHTIVENACSHLVGKYIVHHKGVAHHLT